MAGDWIKMRGNLWDDPRVSALVEATDSSEAAVVGALYWMWATADQHSEDGLMTGLTVRQIDRKTGVPSFASALESIGWIEIESAGIRIARFEEHNGSSAKKRVLTAKRVAKHAVKGNSPTHQKEATNASCVSPALGERYLEKEIEIDLKNSCESPDGDPLPTRSEAIPYQAIIDGYNTTLSKLPKVRELTAKRKTAIRIAWQESAARRSRAFWEQFWEECADDSFLNGTGPYRGEHTNWRPNFDYLIRSATVTRVYETAMHRVETAQ